MRKSIGIATFFVIGVGAAGAGALNNVQMKGSDTLAEVTRDLLAVCPGADPAGADGIVYIGTGSTNGQTAMRTAGASAGVAQQTIAPMSRFLSPFGNAASPGNTCNVGATGSPAGSFGTADASEGLVFALDGVSIVGSKSSAGSPNCNGALDDCSTASDPNAGLVFNRQVTGLADTVRYPGGNYTFNNWRDVLRVVFGGMEQNAGNVIANRTCNSELRRKVADTYGLLFQSGSCTDGSCTQLRHAFIRDNESGTTDVFVALLNLTSVNLPGNTSPFCNFTTDALPANVAKYSPDYQDRDPVRRACAANEEVCGRTPTAIAGVTQFGLGLVLTVTSTDFIPTVADAFPTAPCVSFDLVPLIPPALPPIVRRCPNGDLPAFGSQCFYPKSAAGSFKCLNPNNLRPSLVIENIQVEGRFPSQADGRVYNAHLLKDPAPGGTFPSYEIDNRNRGLEGAFYRIHSTKSIAAPTVTCQNRDATSQIGCLVAASPCSIGVAGRGATDDNPNTAALKVSALHPSQDCIQSLTYPLSRKLYVNSMQGFQDADVAGHELELAKCFANRATIDPIIGARGFITLPATNPLTGNPLNPYCEDFRETQCDNLSNPANVNACANNGAVGLPTETTICGNGTREYGEQCDDGNNVNGDNCNSTCQLEN